MKAKLQREREIKREETHATLIIAQHTNSLWEKREPASAIQAAKKLRSIIMQE